MKEEKVNASFDSSKIATVCKQAYRNALLLAGDRTGQYLCIRFHCCFETFGERVLVCNRYFFIVYFGIILFYGFIDSSLHDSVYV